MNTGELAQFDWPATFYLQGGKYAGVRPNSNGSLVLAFVEVFPTTPRTFLRREGTTVAEAEAACWEAWQAIVSCPRHPGHGPFERRDYRNGSGFCVHCGGWFGPELTGFNPLPDAETETALELENFMKTGSWQTPPEG